MPSAGSVHVDVLPDLQRFGPQLRSQLTQVGKRAGRDSGDASADEFTRRWSAKVNAIPDPEIQVSADTGAAMSKLAAVQAAADRLDGRTVRIDVDTRGDGPRTPTGGGGGRGGSGGGSGGQQPFTGVTPAQGAAVSTVGPSLIPGAAALTGALAGLTSGLSAATAGAGAWSIATAGAVTNVVEVLELQEEAAEGGREETEAYQKALEELTPAAQGTVSAWGDLTEAYQQWQRGLQGDTLPLVTRAMGIMESQLPTLTPLVREASAGFDTLLDSTEAALGGAHWQQFMSFAERQAQPSIEALGESAINLGLGFTGLLRSFEPLWNVMAPGMEELTARFRDWSNESSNFTGFINWVIAEGPTFIGMFGSFADAAIDVGTALAPLGTVYAQGLTVLADAISAVAEEAPWLIQAAVAAGTLRTALSLLGRVQTGLIQPLNNATTSVGNMATQMRTAATAGRGMRTALSGTVGLLGGPWGVALAAATTALGVWISQKQEATQQVQEFVDAIREDNGALAENSREVAANALEQEGALEAADQLGLSLQDVTDAALGQSGALSELNDTLDEREKKLAEQQESDEITLDRYGEQINAVDSLRNAVSSKNNEVNEAVEANRRQNEAAGETTAQQNTLNNSLAGGAYQARDFKTALNELTNTHITATEAEYSFNEAVRRSQESVAQNGATLNKNTAAGKANHDQLTSLRDRTNELVQAKFEETGSVDKATAEHERGRKKFIQVATQMGKTKDEANDLADEYLGIPGDVRTEILVSAAGQWSEGVRKYAENTTASRPWGEHTASPGVGGLATGGPVAGPGTATSDSIPAMLSDGEFVEPTSTVSYYGSGFMEALRHRAIPKDALPGFANGGSVWTSTGTGPNAWSRTDDHRNDVREGVGEMYSGLITSLGDHMAEQWSQMVSGPAGVVGLAEASIGEFPEVPSGSNSNAITSWYGMNGAPWCFAAGTLVQGHDRLVEIQDIRPGDEVRAPSGQSRRVSQVYRRTKPLLKVRILGVPDTLATADHPYMTNRGWVKAGDLRNGDKVAKPVPRTGHTPVSDAYARLVGLYVAEGYRGHRDRCVTMCVSRAEGESVALLAKEAGYEPYITQHRTCALVTIYDGDLYARLGAAGDGAASKEVPGFVFDWDETARRAFLAGYVGGDGHKPPSRSGVVVCTTVSKPLTVSLTGLLSTLDVSAAVRSPRPARVEQIQGRTVSCQAQFVVEWREHPSQKAQHRFDGGVLWVPVRSVMETGEAETVYDIQVEGEHAFIANGVHVHNCAMFISWLFSQAGASAALGSASRTAWTGDYYTSGMSRAGTPIPGDVAVYGTRHVNLVTSPGGDRRIGGNQSNNVTASSGYGGGSIFRPNWSAAGFARGGLVDIMSQDRREDDQRRVGTNVELLRGIAGLANGGTANGWAVVGEEGPELARFDDPARIYSNQESARMLSESRRANSQAQGGDGVSGSLIGEYHQHLHDSQATLREAMGELTHTLRVARKGGRYAHG